MLLDHDPDLMDKSYRLRYQVYCIERGFLDPAKYPDRLERDEFDRYSLHLGVLDRNGEILATARLIPVNMCGLPLFRHCQIFPDETELYHERNRIVEVSRLCVSRQLNQRRQERASSVSMLYRALYQVSKRAGFTHWLVATEHSLQRLVADFGFPFREIGPTVDYFGLVSPYLMDLQEFDQVIVSGTKPVLSSFLEGLELELLPAGCVAMA
jgi:N-acyl-L-homoserine lactone synthetase